MTHCPLAVAPHFHLQRGWAERVRVRTGADWRSPNADKLAALLLDPTSPREALDGSVCLFVIPGHMRSAFWQMLELAGGVNEAGFEGFVAEVSRFLAFKHLPPPTGAVFELVLTRPDQPVNLGVQQLWGVINLGDEGMSIVFGDVQVRLDAGEGCRVPAGLIFDIGSAESEEPNVFLVIRRGD